MLVTENITKNYKNLLALDNASISLEKGQIIAYLVQMVVENPHFSK